MSRPRYTEFTRRYWDSHPGEFERVLEAARVCERARMRMNRARASAERRGVVVDAPVLYTPAQERILSVLASHGAVRQRDLYRLVGLSQAGLCISVERLILDGRVERVAGIKSEIGTEWRGAYVEYRLKT